MIGVFKNNLHEKLMNKLKNKDGANDDPKLLYLTVSCKAGRYFTLVREHMSLTKKQIE
jgi:hypothetical protein